MTMHVKICEAPLRTESDGKYARNHLSEQVFGVFTYLKAGTNEDYDIFCF